MFRVVTAATIVAAVLRVFRLGSQSLWVDETFTWLFAGGRGSLSVRDLLDNVHGPLYALAVHACMQAFGTHEWTLRLPSAIAGILTVPAFAWLAARWLGREAVAPAAWLAAFSPFLVWYSQEARSYSLLMLLTCLSGALLLDLHRRCDAAGVLRYLAAAAAGTLSSFAFAFLAPLHLRWWLGGDSATLAPRRRALAATAVLLVLVALPWAPQTAHLLDWHRLVPSRSAEAGETPLRGKATFHVAAIPYAAYAFSVGYSLGPPVRELRAHPGLGTLRRHGVALAGTGLTFAALTVLGLLAVGRRRRLADAVLWLVAPTALVSYFAAQNFKVFHPRYLAAALPCWLLLIAAAFADMDVRWRRVFGTAVAAIWAVSLYQYYDVPAYAREDYRGALAAVRAGLRPGEQVLAAGADTPVYFYGSGLSVKALWLGFAARPERMHQKLTETLSGAPGAWVVLSRTDDLDPGDLFAHELDTWYPHAGRWSGPGVRVWHLAGDRPQVAPAPGAVPAN